MRRIALLVVATSVTTAHADDRPGPASLFCVYPKATPLPECFKGNSLGEEFVEECIQRNKRRKKVPPRVRIDKGAWVEFSPTKWRCLPAPAGKSFTYAIENHGRLFIADRMTIPTTPCPTGRVDLVGPTFYGSTYAKCSKRKTTDRDEIVP